MQQTTRVTDVIMGSLPSSNTCHERQTNDAGMETVATSELSTGQEPPAVKAAAKK